MCICYVCVCLYVAHMCTQRLKEDMATLVTGVLAKAVVNGWTWVL